MNLVGGASGPYVLDEFGELYEEIDECENIFAREKHSEAKVGEYTGPSWFLGRNKFVFSSLKVVRNRAAHGNLDFNSKERNASPL